MLNNDNNKLNLHFLKFTIFHTQVILNYLHKVGTTSYPSGKCEFLPTRRVFKPS